LTEKRAMIEPGIKLSIRQQCMLLCLCRSNLYYTPSQESEENLRIMRVLDEQYLKTPFYGLPRLWNLVRKKGYIINKKRVKRLM
jgi:putative transposase